MEITQEKSKSKVCVHTKIHSAQRSLLHWHYNYEICQVLENQMRFLVNGVLVEAQAGDVIVIEENVLHQFQSEYGPAQVRVLQFSLKVLMEAGIPLKRCKVHITTKEMDRITGLKEQLNFLFETIETEGHIKSDENNYFQQCMAAALYCLLTRHFAEEGGEDFTQEQKEFLRVLEYINDHFEEDINVNTLAKRLFLYRGRLSALFMKYSGMSMNEYVYSLRIKKANELMNQGSSIMEAALESGFQSIRTFNNIYKKVTGITPKEYKKRSLPLEMPPE